MVISSGTSSPRSMYAWAAIPSGVPSRAAARNRSPVATLGSAEVAGQDVRLGPLPGARGAEQDEDPHRIAPVRDTGVVTG